MLYQSLLLLSFMVGLLRDVCAQNDTFAPSLQTAHQTDE